MNKASDNFLRAVVKREGGGAVLFEPYICDFLAEQLIWRRGEHLWNDPVRYTETQLYLRDITKAEVVCLDLMRFDSDDRRRMIEYAASLNESDFVLLSDSDKEIELCDGIDSIAAVGGFGSTSPHKKPFIRMDKTPEDAVCEGAVGCYITSSADEMYGKYGTRISLLGGIGVDFIETNQPLSIYRRCEELTELTSNAGYVLGSGALGNNVIRKEHYLELISFLGAYRRYR